MDRNVILDVKNLSTTFHTERGDYQAISGVSFQIRKGEIVGIVGESGCGKSVTSQSILRLYDEHREARHSGEVLFENDDLLKLSQKEMERRRGSDIAMIFQDALSTLNPVLTIGYQLREPMRTMNAYQSDPSLYDMFVISYSSVPLPTLKFYLGSGAGFWTTDETFQNYISCFNQATTKDEAYQIWEELQAYCWNDYLPVINCGHYQECYAWNADTLSNVNIYNNIAHMWSVSVN